MSSCPQDVDTEEKSRRHLRVSLQRGSDGRKEGFQFTTAPRT